MRNLLLLALLLYDVVTFANRPSNYDYDDNIGNKKHSFDDRRNWRKKALQKPFDSENKEWDDRRRYENYNPRYADDVDMQGPAGDRHRQLDLPGSIYKDGRRYEDELKMPPNIRSSEIDHAPPYIEKESQRKALMAMNCGRQHERYEACFAGCAAVTCDNPRERLRPCYPFCEPGCVCTHPYVRDDRTHKCVLPDDCSKGLKGIPDLGEEI
ncbi:uncharacterized protein [Epargyreus clarus]|uniref:uncharacterized protein n=1 Tax=Epargyreus clarus TaxID=520877 RepID=UPI003C2D5693